MMVMEEETEDGMAEKREGAKELNSFALAASWYLRPRFPAFGASPLGTPGPDAWY